MTDQMTKPAPMTVAPQVKAVPDTVTTAFDEFMEAFEAFRETNDQRLADIERKMGADVVTRDKLDRIDRTLDDNRRIMDDLALRKARPALGRKDALSHDAEEHKAAFEAYIRRGEEGALRDLEAKAFAGSTGADGGFLLPSETDGEIGRRMTAISPIRALATVRQVSAAVLKTLLARRHDDRLGLRNGGAPADGNAAACRAFLPDDGALRHAGGHAGPAG